MSRQVQEIETVLRKLIEEHRALLAQVESQQVAMRAGRSEDIEQATHQQEATRRRIAVLDARRRQLALAIGAAMRMPAEPSVTRLAELFPARSQALLTLRDELRAAMEDLATRMHVVARLTSALLGHLNSAVRMIAGAVEQAGVYTKSGAPQLSARIGAMEAVG